MRITITYAWILGLVGDAGKGNIPCYSKVLKALSPTLTELRIAIATTFSTKNPLL
ncbi:hypothetical protein [Coleofasciculus sp. H7-2]|uniref:hypothetical protein n=1 Tax=Coleofasciculus sp. H7-2 TaxID=3351545 RepID=UPI00366E5462